ncbi:MAG TPA: hypothetical protein VIE13_03190 [Terriglobales bacterium]|jgi:hypothetical protein
MKRTTLTVDAKLLKEAGARTYSEAVNVSLSEAVRRNKVLALRELFGSHFWEGELETMRRPRFSTPTRKKELAGHRR